MAQEPNLNEPASAKATAGEVDSVKKELEAAKAKCEEYLNGWKRERADFLNYKKDEMERIGELAKYANVEIILKIIPILDNIYLAETHVPEELKKNKWIEGFTQIKNQLNDFLAKEGIEAVETIGKDFDPNTMESTFSLDKSPSNKVVGELRKGYTMHGKLIRPAKVKLG